MKRSIKKVFLVMAVMMMVFGSLVNAQERLAEVEKGEIPEQYLSVAIKELPMGIKIWDEEEALAALNEEGKKVLWVDTRPANFYRDGTLKDAVLLVYYKDESLSKLSEGETNILTKEKLEAALKNIDENTSNVTIAFFCQGPKCHRSYNAALHCVQDWGYSADKIVWFRPGYPGLLKYIKDDAKLERKMRKYFSGGVVSE